MVKISAILINLFAFFHIVPKQMLVSRLSNRGIPFNHYDYLQSFKILPYRRLDLFQIRASVRLKIVLRTYVGGLSETRYALVTMMDMLNV